MLHCIIFLYLLISIRLAAGAVEDVSHAPTMVEVTDQNLLATVTQGTAPWLVLVYGGNSTFAATALEYFKVGANVLKLAYKFGYMNIQNNSIMMETFKMIAIDDATLFMFGDDRSNPRVILQSSKSWEVSYFVREGIKAFHDMLLWRLQNFNVDKKPKRQPIEITGTNFLPLIQDQDYEGTYSPWLILFYSEDDLESQMLQQTFEIASAELFPKVRTAKINVEKELALTQYFFDLLFLPTVMYVGKRSHSEAYSNPILPMSQMPTAGHICNFGLSERLLDMSAFESNGVSAVIVSVGDLPYNDARILRFNSNTSLHLFSRL